MTKPKLNRLTSKSVLLEVLSQVKEHKPRVLSLKGLRGVKATELMRNFTKSHIQIVGIEYQTLRFQVRLPGKSWNTTNTGCHKRI